MPNSSLAADAESLALWTRTRAEWLARTGGAPRPTGPRRAVLKCVPAAAAPSAVASRSRDARATQQRRDAHRAAGVDQAVPKAGTARGASEEARRSRFRPASLTRRRALPRQEVVDFLVECWEDDGLYA